MEKKKSSSIILIILLVIVIMALAGFLAYKFAKDAKDTKVEPVAMENLIDEPEFVEPEPIKEVQIFKGEDRPIAVMIDNHSDARPQVGINDAYMVYEILVEGGITRMMAVFKGVDLEEIGPVRSARHYFLDYALENDAIYVHFGASPQALSDISGLRVNAINGISQNSSEFWRTKGKYAPHNVLTTTKKILEIAESRKYATTSTQESVLNYVVDEVNLEDGQEAIEIYIPFSKSQNVSFEYDAERQVYVKSANGKKQVDWRSEEDIAFKNLIVTFVQNYDLNDMSGKGRQGINNIKTLKGYYITNGHAIEITCEKTSRSAQTIYRDLEGNEIDVNDGNTYLGLCPIDAQVTIKGNPKPEIEEEETGEVIDE